MLRPESTDDQAFRAEVRGWLEANLPDDIRYLTFRPAMDVAMAWHRKLAERGWIAPHWPRRYGGMEATPVRQLILLEELSRAGAPDIPAQGLFHIGPVLIKFGTEVQKQHLPKILSGQITWAQGYSEPNSGSDLASLNTRGKIVGNEIVINGQKIWTSEAHSADWIFALVRTGEGSSGRNGISFILADLKTPGISRRQIADISGNDELCEVFFDDVHVPLDNVVGRLNDGWAVATTLLAEERIRAGGPWHSLRALERLRAIVRFKGRSNDPYALDRLAQAEIEVATMCASYLDALERLEQGKTEAKDSSYIKILGTETTQFVLDVVQELAGSARAVKRPFRCSAGYVDFSEFFLQSRRLSIYGGSNEIQRTLLAMRALGLPKGAA